MPDDTFPIGPRQVRRLGYGAWLLSLAPHVLAIPAPPRSCTWRRTSRSGGLELGADHFALLDRA